MNDALVEEYLDATSDPKPPNRAKLYFGYTEKETKDASPLKHYNLLRLEWREGDAVRQMFATIPLGANDFVYALCETRVCVHEYLFHQRGLNATWRLFFDLEVEDGTSAAMQLEQSGGRFKVMPTLVTLIRKHFKTRVIVWEATRPGKISYHILCLDVGTVKMTTMRRHATSFAGAVGRVFPTSGFDLGVYCKHAMRVGGAAKPLADPEEREATRLRFVPGLSCITVEEAGYPLIRGPYEHELEQKDVDDLVKRRGVKVGFQGIPPSDGWSVAAQYCASVGLTLTKEQSSHGSYVAENLDESFSCPLCDRNHESVGAAIYLNESGMSLLCYRNIDTPGATKKTFYVSYHEIRATTAPLSGPSAPPAGPAP